jgi:hypothetical protein
MDREIGINLETDADSQAGISGCFAGYVIGGVGVFTREHLVKLLI